MKKLVMRLLWAACSALTRRQRESNTLLLTVRVFILSDAGWEKSWSLIIMVPKKWTTSSK